MAAEVTDATFETEVLQSDIPVLVDFWAPWCGPCRAMGPIIEELSQEFKGKVKILKINVDENSGSATKYGIRAIPTLILFDKGEIAEQSSGAMAKSSLKELLESKL